MRKILFFTFLSALFYIDKSSAQCTASFNFTANGDTILFYNTSAATGDSIVSYLWDFGDGGTDSTENSIHTYHGCGSYIATLNINTLNGCNSTTEDTIVISGTANISLIALVDSSSGNVTITATPNLPGYFFNWGFSDGGTGVGSTVTNNFPPGMQWACTIFSDNSGACATDTFCTFFNVNYTAPACQALFNYTANGTTVSFSNTSTAPGDSITGYQWSFGNFQSSTVTNPTQTYASCGSYIIQLTMYTLSGCSNSIFDTIQVPGQINGNYTYTVDTLTGNAQFFATPNNSNYSFAWNFGDGGTDTGANPSHIYLEGSYTACVIISNISGACIPDTICNSLIIDIDTIPINCSATWTNVGNGTNQTFIADSLNFTDTYNWDFGDGNTGTGPIANHNYGTPGIYTVCLNYVSVSTGCTAQFCDTIDIPACSMQITYTGTDGNITFNAAVAGGGIFPVVVWSFGDGTTGTGLNPTHQYDTNGVKIVCALLNPSPLPGCKDTVCILLNITGVGIEEYDIENSLAVSPNPFGEEIKIDFKLSHPTDYSVSLFDITGKQITTTLQRKNETGHQTNIIQTEELETGIYFVCVNTGGKVVRRRIIKN